jgi:hypothetical protein
MWQWTSNGSVTASNGGYQRVDQDAFNGSPAALAAYAQVGNLVKQSGNTNVYLISGGQKHQVATFTDYVALSAALGPAQTISASTLAAIPSAGNVTRYVRDPSNGSLYLLEVYGSKHYFSSFALVNSYGFDTNSYTNLDSYQINAFPTGAQVGSLFTDETSPVVYFLENGNKRLVSTWHAATVAGDSSAPFIAQMPDSGFQALPTGPAYVAPNYPVHENDDSRVFMAVDDSTLVYLPSFGMESDFNGSTNYDSVPNGTINSLKVLAGSLTPLVSCASSVYIASNGTMIPVTGTNYGGLTPTVLPADACSNFTISGSSVSSPIFVQPRGQGAVYVIANGQLQHVMDWPTLVAMNGNRPVTLVSWSAETAASIPAGPPVLAAGNFVQFSGSPNIYLFQNGQLDLISSYSRLIQLGGGSLPTIVQIATVFKSAYSFGPTI